MKLMNGLTRDNLIEMCQRRFSESQMKEIIAGLDASVDVSVYAKECYNNRQMEQLRIGLTENLDVSRYADPSLSVEEMQQIRIALIEEVEKAS